MSSDRHVTSLIMHPGVLVLWVVLFAVWMMANSTLAGIVALIGLLLTLGLASIFAARTDAWRQINPTARSAFHFLAYTGTFAAELVSANLGMLGHVYAPRMNIKPGIVRVRTRLKSPIGRLALANSIALTPGSLILDIKGDQIFVHWLDVRTTAVDETTRLIGAPFEKHLERVFG